MKKILIVYATAGIGHAKASFALSKAFEELAIPGVEVKMIDALDYMTPRFRKSYLDSYLLAINKFPRIWGLAYAATNNVYLDKVSRSVRRFINWLNSRKFVAFLKEYKPDVVLATHFLANEVISNLKRKGVIDTTLITVVTDYRFHAYWLGDKIDLYIVGSQEAVGDLSGWGVGPERVEVLGIPVEPAFTKKNDTDEIAQRLGVETGRFTVLVVGGGFGVGPIEKIVEAIAGISERLQVIVVCGYNEALRRKVEALKGQVKARLVVYGFVDNMYDLMQVSQCLVSKSGGLTATESLVKGLPLIVTSPIPGQESRNAEFLIKHGVAVRVDDLASLVGAVRAYLEDPKRLETERQAIAKIARPQACYDIAKRAVDMCKQR